MDGMSAAVSPDLVLRPVQRQRKRALLAMGILAGLSLLFIQAWKSDGPLHIALELFGIALIGTAVLGRTWCSLYIGGRKSREIRATGPYSLCRNPLYLFSCIGVLGMGLQTASVTFAFSVATAATAVFLLVIFREEAALQMRFGATYSAYCARVPRLIPKFSGWMDEEILPVRPRFTWRTLREGMLLFLAIPVCELFDHLHEAGYLSGGLRLP